MNLYSHFCRFHFSLHNRYLNFLHLQCLKNFQSEIERPKVKAFSTCASYFCLFHYSMDCFFFMFIKPNLPEEADKAISAGIL